MLKNAHARMWLEARLTSLIGPHQEIVGYLDDYLTMGNHFFFSAAVKFTQSPPF